MSTPGAATAICGPILEARNILSSTSVADTAITFGSAAGYCGGDFGPKLPEAAIVTMPLPLAAAIWRGKAGAGGARCVMFSGRAPFPARERGALFTAKYTVSTVWTRRAVRSVGWG